MAPNVVACLSFYDEPIEKLIQYVSSCSLSGIDRIVALDGAYAQFPGGCPRSPTGQHAALCEVSGALGLSLSLVLPNHLWESEMEKRTALFRHALAMCPEGWFLSMDADEYLSNDVNVPELLEDVYLDAAEVTVVDLLAAESGDPSWQPDFTQRRLFRAQPISVRVNHYTYCADDGRFLWTAGGNSEVEGVVIPEITIKHNPRREDPERQLAKTQYYATREESGLERGTCDRCQSQKSTQRAALRWQFTKDGRPVSVIGELCAACAKAVDKINRIKLRQHGIDPDTVRVSERYGVIPVR